MKLIDIVTHCWAGKFRHYADALVYQLSSLLLHPPEKCQVEFTICFDADDTRTTRVVDWFINYLLEQNPLESMLDIGTINLSAEELGRRAIGRNLAAKYTAADIVWFSDCDQVYRDGVLDRLATMEWPEGASMIYPRHIKIHQDHATGDRVTGEVGDDVGLVDVDTNLFVPKRYNRAIGGVQIVQGDFTRKYGYLDNRPDWRAPVEKPFGSFKDDIIYREFCKQHGKIVGVDLPGVYRLRHTRTTYQ